MKQVLGLDIDGVLADWLAAVQVVAYREHGLDVMKHFTSWWPKESAISALLADFTKDLEFYCTLVPVNRAAWGVEQLAMSFDNIFYVTHRPPATRNITLEWLERWSFPVYDLVIPRGSKLVSAKRLGITHFVDDKPATVTKMREAGIIAYLFQCHDVPMESSTAIQDWVTLVSTLSLRR